VTQDKWDEQGRHVGGPAGLLVVRLGANADNAIHPRELWRYDKGFAVAGRTLAFIAFLASIAKVGIDLLIVAALFRAFGIHPDRRARHVHKPLDYI